MYSCKIFSDNQNTCHFFKAICGIHRFMYFLQLTWTIVSQALCSHNDLNFNGSNIIVGSGPLNDEISPRVQLVKVHSVDSVLNSTKSKGQIIQPGGWNAEQKFKWTNLRMLDTKLLPLFLCFAQRRLRLSAFHLL